MCKRVSYEYVCAHMEMINFVLKAYVNVSWRKLEIEVVLAGEIIMDVVITF